MEGVHATDVCDVVDRVSRRGGIESGAIRHLRPSPQPQALVPGLERAAIAARQPSASRQASTRPSGRKKTLAGFACVAANEHSSSDARTWISTPARSTSRRTPSGCSGLTRSTEGHRPAGAMSRAWSACVHRPGVRAADATRTPDTGLLTEQTSVRRRGAPPGREWRCTLKSLHRPACWRHQ
jgi:hypothetical protein